MFVTLSAERLSGLNRPISPTSWYSRSHHHQDSLPASQPNNRRTDARGDLSNSRTRLKGSRSEVLPPSASRLSRYGSNVVDELFDDHQLNVFATGTIVNAFPDDRDSALDERS